jgi:CheY-like chemotaxis protein
MGVALVHEHDPWAIVLDAQLPDIDGWRVLDRLKSDLATRHIPICLVASADDARRARRLGAFSVLSRPAARQTAIHQLLGSLDELLSSELPRVLVVGDDAALGGGLQTALATDGIEVDRIETAEELVESFSDDRLRCAILCPEVPREVVETLADLIGPPEWNRNVPVILSAAEDDTLHGGPLQKLAELGIVQSAATRERLLDRAWLHLHVPMSSLSEPQRLMVAGLHKSPGALAGKKVLVVDDDVRNIFALTSVLERQHIQVISAETGREAIRILESASDLDAVLLDIMMPEMDGIDTMRAIRKLPHCTSLPIVAVTAKAMKGDREKCIEAGAWDYLSKPVDTEQLFCLLRFWCR